MSRKSILLGVVAVLATVTLAPVTDGQAAEKDVDAQWVPHIGRVASFNVCNPLNQCPTTNKAADVAEVIMSIQPEVIALQEICVRQTDEVIEILNRNGMPYEAQHGSVVEDVIRCGGTPADPGNYGNALLTASTFTNSGNELYDVVGEDEQRGYVWGDTKVWGQPVRVYGTHLATLGHPDERTAQVQELAADATAHAGNTIMMGDFNTPPDGTAIAPLWRLWADADPGCAPPSTSACQTTVPSDESPQKFDYIWLERVIYPQSPGLNVVDNWSDHNLVYADLPQPTP